MFKHTRMLSVIFLTCFTMILIPSWHCSPAYCAGNDAGISFMDEKPLYPGYPVMFDILGKIYRVSESEIVINDTLLKLTRTTLFVTPYTKNAGISRFQKGDIAGIKLGKNRQVISIWLIKKHT